MRSQEMTVREMRARVKALLRRAGRSCGTRGNELHRITLGGLKVDEVKRQVHLDGEAIELTVKEFELLLLFIKNPGRAFSRNDLLTLVWGYSYEGYEHTVNTHINRLRRKIEQNPASPVYLKTVWGIGYRFAEPSELQANIT